MVPENLKKMNCRIDVFFNEEMLNYSAGDGLFDTLESPKYIVDFDGHPENSSRIKNIVSILQNGPIAPYVSFQCGKKAKLEDLEMFHTRGKELFGFVFFMKCVG